MWWLSDYPRVGREKAAVEGVVSEGWFELTRWKAEAFRFCAEGVITARGATYPVRLIYPDQFPHVPAWVEPQDTTARWSNHQYGDGGLLCLELRPDNWNPDATGADVLRSAYNLLSVENPLGEGERGSVLSGHRIGNLQSYDWGKEPVMIAPGCAARLLDGSAAEVSALRWSRDDNVWPILIFDGIDRAKPTHPPSFDLGTLRFEVPVVVVQAKPPDASPATRADLAEALAVELPTGEIAPSLVVVAVNKERMAVYHSTGDTEVYERKWVLLPDDAGKRSGRSSASAGKRVAIIGLGSVGSKIAESVVRSGIYDLVLADGDILLPDNLERHVLDWRDVGFRKANAMKRRLHQIVSGAKIEVVPVNLNWQQSAKVQAEQVDKLLACDLIVNATGDAATGLWLGALADANGKPFVSASVFEGGIGCLIARSLPGRDPAFGLAKLRYEAFCDVENVEPPTSGQRAYEAVMDGGAPIVADDAAATMCASHAARVILDVLDETVGDEDPAWLLVGFKLGWLFRHHGHTITLDVGQPAVREEPDDDEDAHMFALALAREAVDAAKNSR